MDMVRQHMASAGLVPNELVADGKIHRFKADANDSGKAGWYVGYENKTKNGDTYYVFTYGNYKTDEKHTYKPNRSLTASEDIEIKKQIKASARKVAMDKENDQLKVSDSLMWSWQNDDWSTLSSDYIARKNITHVEIGKFKTIDSQPVIHLPVQDLDGRIWSFQRIWPDGKKMFMAGSRAVGGFVKIGDIAAPVIYLCEGFATGSTIHQAMGDCVICALSASNLKNVASTLKAKYPDKKYVVCGDDDRFTLNNPGRKNAIAAAHILSAKCVLPKFNSDDKLTDFNDMHLDCGIDAVRQLIMADQPIPTDDEYEAYRAFFAHHLTGCKRDIISREFLKFDGRFWQSPLNNLDAIRSYAMGHGLNSAKVQAHLDRYILEQEFEPLFAIPDWDGEDRVAALKPYIKLKGHEWLVFEDALKEWGANIFRRLYDESAQNRCIILKGDQGIGKDRLIENLLKGFKPYYSKFSSNRDERAIWDQVTSNLVLHIEEFDQTGSMGVAFLKDLVTRDYVSYRSPYARAQITRKCFASFISTVNIDAILRDETGNRRFAVFEIESIDWEYPKDDSGQILAQFHALYLKNYRANKVTWDAVMKGNAQFEQVDMTGELLGYWDDTVGKISKASGKTEFIFGSIHEIIEKMCKMSGLKPKTVCGLLKMNGRSKKVGKQMRYFSHYPADNSDKNKEPEQVTKIDEIRKKVIKNYADFLQK